MSPVAPGEYVDCNEVLEQLSEFLDDGARADLCREIEQHLSRCRECRFYVDSVKKTIVLYQADREVDVPTAVSVRLQAAMASEYEAIRRDD
jgi:predicted anti-sigma-YlaC factor YlaD